jgi:regulatory protein
MSSAGIGRGSRSRRSRDGDPATTSVDSCAESGHAVEGAPSKHAEDSERRARDIVYRLLAVRARSRSELTQALLRKGIEEAVADAVIRKFDKAGLVDDAAFAEDLVHEHQRNRGLGRKALAFELRRKGVDESVIAETLSTVDYESEADRARELVRRKLRTMTATDKAARMRRLVGMLARKGYSEDMAFRVVREELEWSGLDSTEDDARMS